MDLSDLNPFETLREIERVECETSLYEFVQRAWRYVDPSPFTPGWPLEAMCEHLEAVVDGDIRKLIINIPPRCGKQVADDTPVLTTKGWRRHGDLRVGDYVFSPSGKPVRVKAVSAKTPSNVRVEFFDGSVVYCHENHEWTLFNRSARKWETVETRVFLEPRKGRWGKTGKTNKRASSGGRALHQLPLVQPVQFPAAALPLDPYVLGVWLGDGSTGKACVTHSPKDREHIDHIINIGFGPSAVWTHKETGVLTTSFAYSSMRERLRDAGVLKRKHIPDTYLVASVQQRLQLLAGLLDTDGHVDKSGRCHFTNTNRALIDGVIALVRSMGWHVSVIERAPSKSSSGIQGTKPYWVVGFQPTEELPTRLPRKQVKRFAARRAVGLKSVTYDPRGKKGHCIEVDAADGLYLVGRNLTPTHNSSIVSVCFPAWVWTQREITPTSGPQVPLLHASYAMSLAMRDSVKTRRLVESPWYQRLWGHRFQLVGDQNTKGRFQNDKRGERLITAVDARVTGEGGNIIVVDDPNAANEAMSEALIETTNEWWDGTMSTRLNDARTGAYVVIQQRLGEEDLTGHILDTDDGWTHLMLPMEFEPERSVVTSIGWEDPRTEAGELLWPERFATEQVEVLKKRLGPWKCSPGEAPILMSDLSMKRVDRIAVGDSIIGFDRKRRDDTYGRYRLTPATVTEVHSFVAPVVKMTLDSGAVIRCTRDHRWFMRDKGGDRPVYLPVTLGRSKLARVCPPTLPEMSKEDERLAGWLAGFFDGEGTVSLQQRPNAEYPAGATIQFYQGSGRNKPLCDKLEYALKHFGFEFTVSEDERKPNKNAPCYGYRNYRITNPGGVETMQRFLHIVQPTKWRDRIESGVLKANFIKQREKVISVEPDGEELVYGLTTTTGNYVVWGLASANSAGQLQQRPEPKGGGIIKRDWWQLHDAPHFPQFDYVLASLDTAFTTKQENDFSALTVWGIFTTDTVAQPSKQVIRGERLVNIDPRDYGNQAPKVMLMNAWQERLELHDLVQRVAKTCKEMKVDRLLIEDKAAGHSVAQELRRLFGYEDFAVQLVNPGAIDKVARVYAIQHIFAEGMVFAPDRQWAEMTIAQCTAFPRGKFDDITDTVSQALTYMRRAGLLTRSSEHISEVGESLKHRGAPPANLYGI